MLAPLKMLILREEATLGSATTTPRKSQRRELVSLFSKLRESAGQANPLPIYAELRRMGEVIPAPWGGTLVNSYSLAQQVLRDKQWTVPDRAWRIQQGAAARWSSPASLQMSQTLPLLNPPAHTQMRRPLGNVFNQSTLADLHRVTEGAVEVLLDEFTDRLRGGPADFVALVSEKLPIMIIGEWMGLPSKDHELLRDLTHDQVHTQELFPTASEVRVSDAATARLQVYFTNLIQDRRRTPGDDPVSTWIRTWDDLEGDPVLTDAAVHSLALFMILAALETTSHLITSTVRLLLEHPTQLDLVRQHPDLVPDTVDEALRYDAPIHLVSRVATAHTELGGVAIAPGETVQILIGAAHHDPEHFTDPHAFDVRRRGVGAEVAPATRFSSHLAFGAGIHYCLGNALARMEATTLLTSLLRRRIQLRLSAPPQWASRVVFRRITSLHLTLAVPRHEASQRIDAR
ncbi:cytochrome P450 [Streptomyces sp. 5.8]|uniref:cytochrome P450 n=1 Tax=Streptomyces sp. 5.8 TaxID=3406571 RepID=UPI003BB50B28